MLNDKLEFFLPIRCIPFEIHAERSLSIRSKAYYCLVFPPKVVVCLRLIQRLSEPPNAFGAAEFSK